jgi:hypothetical protein
MSMIIADSGICARAVSDVNAECELVVGGVS